MLLLHVAFKFYNVGQAEETAWCRVTSKWNHWGGVILLNLRLCVEEDETYLWTQAVREYRKAQCADMHSQHSQGLTPASVQD